jgi:hypothetical protein
MIPSETTWLAVSRWACNLPGSGLFATRSWPLLFLLPVVRVGIQIEFDEEREHPAPAASVCTCTLAHDEHLPSVIRRLRPMADSIARSVALTASSAIPTPHVGEPTMHWT